MSCRKATELDLAAFAVDRQAEEWAGFRAHYPLCPDCSREVARWSELLGALQGDAAAEAGHPTSEGLYAYQYALSSLADDERSSVEQHLAGCGACRSELALLERFDFTELAAAPEVEASAGEPSIATRLSAWLGELLGAGPRPALALALVVALLIASGIAVQRLATRPGVEARAPLQARSDPSPATEKIEMRPAGDDASQVERIAEAPRSERPVAQEPAPAPPPPPRTPRTRDPLLPPDDPEALAHAPEEPSPFTEEKTATGEPPLQLAALLPMEAPLYQPDPGLFGGSLESARVHPMVRASGQALPEILALAPEHVGATANPSPTLYWFLSGPSPVPVEISISDEIAFDPLLEIQIPAPIEAGIHALSLAKRGVQLQLDRRYAWFVTLVPRADQRDADVISGAAIRRIPLGKERASRLGATPPAERAHAQAALGYWYDAFETLSRWSNTGTAPPRLERQRGALLEQVGLDTAARAISGSPGAP